MNPQSSSLHTAPGRGRRWRVKALAALTVLWVTASALPASAADREFGLLVHHIESYYHARRSHRLLIAFAGGFANVVIAVWRPAGVKNFKLALFEDQTSIAAKVLADAQVTEQHVETLVLQAAPRGSSTDDAPLRTPAAIAVFRRAIAEAVRLGHNYVGTEHVLLALFGESEALSARVLAQTGATYDDYRRRVIDKLSRLVVARPEQ